MSFLSPSNRTVALMPFIQSDLGLSNLIAPIGRINDARSQQSVTAAWLLGQVKDFSDSLDSYIAAGSEPSEMLWTIHFCKSLATAASSLLVNELSDDLSMDTMKEVVAHIVDIADTLGEPHYGDSLSDRWSGYIVGQVCTNVFWNL